MKLPSTFVLELTSRCNNRCLYCYTVWGAPIPSPTQNDREMSTAEIKEVIVKLQEETPLKNIGFSGGEPLLREDLPEILNFIKDRGIAPLIITNGTLLTSERVKATMAGGNYQIPLLSYRSEIHDRLAGRKGAWNAAIDGFANVFNARGNSVAVFVSTKMNYMDLFKTAELAIALRANALVYNRVNIGAHNLQFAEQLLPTPSMITENLDMLEEIGKSYKFPIAISVVIEPCIVDITKYEYLRFSWCPLGGEDSYFTIDPRGNIRICNHSPVILGNIREERFSDIYYSHPYVKKFRETMPVECFNCDHELKEICRGGCKAAGEQSYGTMERVDPFVALNKDHR